MANVFIAFQSNQDSRYIVEAILEDNPLAVVDEQPAMVKIDVPNRLVIKRASVEEKMGREFELQEMHMHLITLSGNVDEDDDQFVLELNSYYLLYEMLNRSLKLMSDLFFVKSFYL